MSVLLECLGVHRFAEGGLVRVWHDAEAVAVGYGHTFEVGDVEDADYDSYTADFVFEGWACSPAAEDGLGCLEGLVVEGLAAVGRLWSRLCEGTLGSSACEVGLHCPLAEESRGRKGKRAYSETET